MIKPVIYIVASKRNGTLYVGVTSNLLKRIFEHKNNLIPGFTSKYNCKTLVYYCFFDSIIDAIEAEKKLKKSSRLRKIKLIESTNLLWNDLYSEICS